MEPQRENRKLYRLGHIKDRTGNVHTDPIKIAEIWKEYFEELLEAADSNEEEQPLPHNADVPDENDVCDNYTGISPMSVRKDTGKNTKK